MRRHFEQLTQAGAEYANAILGTEWATQADRWLRAAVAAKATTASKAMDAEYLRTHIGGGWHRLFDGGHDLWGAYKATGHATLDDNFLDHLGVYAHELWKDLATPNGLPVFTWNKDAFDALAQTLHNNLHVSSAWVHDMASFTATELGGAVAAVAAMLLNLKSNDPHRYLEMCGSLGLSAVIAANPILVAVYITYAMNCYFKGRMKIRLWNSLALFRGIILSSVTIVLTGTLGLMGFLLSIPVLIFLRPALRRLCRRVERMWARRFASAMKIEIGRALLKGSMDEMILPDAPLPNA